MTVPSIVCYILHRIEFELEYQKVVLDNIMWARKRSGRYPLSLLFVLRLVYSIGSLPLS